MKVLFYPCVDEIKSSYERFILRKKTRFDGNTRYTNLRRKVLGLGNVVFRGWMANCILQSTDTMISWDWHASSIVGSLNFAVDFQPPPFGWSKSGKASEERSKNVSFHACVVRLMLFGPIIHANHKYTRIKTRSHQRVVYLLSIERFSFENDSFDENFLVCCCDLTSVELSATIKA